MFFFLVVFLFIRYSSEENNECDQSTTKWYEEGNLGQTNLFPWLGVLRLNIFDGTEHKLGATGIVLIKDKYAIANAQEVASIPKAVLKRDAKAFFIPTNGEPWTAHLVDCQIHPEYEIETYNTIALLELDTTTFVPSQEEKIEVEIPMNPICWPSYPYNTSNNLYILGYTDENASLEKVAFRVMFIENDLCGEFYSRIYKNNRDDQSRFICGVDSNNKQYCPWDSGMVLASNTTGVWTLIGFGLQGPGCGGPARFLNLVQFRDWIEATTSIVEELYYDYYHQRDEFDY